MGRIEVGGGAYMKWQTEGQELAGEWRGLSAGKPAPDGKATIVGTVDTADGPVRFSATSVLQTKLGRIREGFTVYIQFLGSVKGKSGVSYKNFRVEVDDAEALAPEPKDPHADDAL